MRNYCIRLKRRGFNYYTDYMERYFENVAVNHGFHLVKRREQAELLCLTFIGEPQIGGSKWITFASDSLKELTYEQLKKLSLLMAECFKSESIIDEIDEELEKIIQAIKAYWNGSSCFVMSDEQLRKYGTPEVWLFSREYSAFDEPPFLADGETILKIVSHSSNYISGADFFLDVQNYGGISKGIAISISFQYGANDIAELENPMVILHNHRDDLEWEWLPLEVEKIITKDRIIYRAALTNFIIPEGVNIYSAKLCGKKKQDEADRRSFRICFIPHGSGEVLESMEIEIIPMKFPANKAHLKIVKSTHSTAF